MRGDMEMRSAGAARFTDPADILAFPHARSICGFHIGRYAPPVLLVYRARIQRVARIRRTERRGNAALFEMIERDRIAPVGDDDKMIAALEDQLLILRLAT